MVEKFLNHEEREDARFEEELTNPRGTLSMGAE